MTSTLPQLLDLLRNALKEGQADNAEALARSCLNRGQRGKTRAHNTFLDFAARHTDPSEKCLFYLLQNERTLSLTSAARFLAQASKSDQVDLLCKVQPSGKDNYLDLLQNIGKGVRIEELAASFIELHRSKERFDRLVYGYEKECANCMFATLNLDLPKEANEYRSLVFNLILKNRTFCWKKRSEPLYLSFFCWLNLNLN